MVEQPACEHEARADRWDNFHSSTDGECSAESWSLAKLEIGGPKHTHQQPLGSERSSAGPAGAGVSVETGWRVKISESKADRAT